VSVVYYNFLDQINDLLNDISIWGDVANFSGTVNMNNPFSNEPIRNDGFVDEIMPIFQDEYNKGLCMD